MRLAPLSAMFLISCCSLLAELPDFYKSVARLTFIVKDAEAASAAWSKAGVAVNPESYRLDIDGEYRGKPVTAPLVIVNGEMGDVRVDWIQPTGGENAFTEYLAKHGDGVFSLMHAVPDQQALNSEVSRMKDLGIPVLQSGGIETDDGTIRFAFLDTEQQGKYVLGLIVMPGHETREGPGLKISQFAFVARDLEPVGRFWARLGFPAMSFTNPTLTDLIYRDQPGKYQSRLGWQRHGKVVYEWIEPAKGPSSYFDHLDKSGEGFHHLGTSVADMDKAIAGWKAKGFPSTMSGGWGEKGKPGSGRFSYQQAPSGIEVELLWNYRGN